jgi:hypothetical protein
MEAEIMGEEPRSEEEPEFRAEIYDHSGPKLLAGPLLLSFVFFACGQLAKGQVVRALVLWALLGGIVALMIVIVSITDPQSTARDVGVYATGSALGVLWIYQLWDAGWRSDDQS